jgi:hypothetical protein
VYIVQESRKEERTMCDLVERAYAEGLTDRPFLTLPAGADSAAGLAALPAPERARVEAANAGALVPRFASAVDGRAP